MPRKASRNAQGGGTIRQRSDGRWEARYTVGRDPDTGQTDPAFYLRRDTKGSPATPPADHHGH